ncbi:MAG: hypothetical protein AAF492_10420, partial [Verrucomicrobiota bacterium]
VFGPFSNRLNNAGEAIELYKPGAPDVEGTPFILVDRVRYRDEEPWPVIPSGGGAGLRKPIARDFGSDPASWMLGPVDSVPALCLNLDSDGDRVPDAWEVTQAMDHLDPEDGGFDLDLDTFSASEEYILGTRPDAGDDRFDIQLTMNDGGLDISFQGVETSGPGYDSLTRIYALEHTSDLKAGIWMAVPECTVQSARNEIMHFLVSPDIASNRLFRVAVSLKPANE